LQFEELKKVENIWVTNLFVYVVAATGAVTNCCIKKKSGLDKKIGQP
jgi:hypothetical protein